jgi:hypothetical protein
MCISKLNGNIITPKKIYNNFYSPFSVQAKVIKLVGLKRPPFLSPTNLITFACTQNGEYDNIIHLKIIQICILKYSELSM